MLNKEGKIKKEEKTKKELNNESLSDVSGGGGINLDFRRSKDGQITLTASDKEGTSTDVTKFLNEIGCKIVPNS